MKAYTKEQIQNLKARNYSAIIDGIAVITKAYFKENALKVLQEHNSDLRMEDVSLSPTINSHTGPCETIEEEYDPETDDVVYYVKYEV